MKSKQNKKIDSVLQNLDTPLEFYLINKDNAHLLTNKISPRQRKTFILNNLDNSLTFKDLPESVKAYLKENLV